MQKNSKWINDPSAAIWMAIHAHGIKSEQMIKIFLVEKIFSLYFDGKLVLVIKSCLGI